ncbi:alpha/beta hydrolase [Lentilactobacillus senioris]|uniref:alpha/beta hydrolase n=1 Tax=Lentilactobacillus senioris TaxID=931534 RepID=UPI002281F1B6|nr:alpha/beta hydrolase [Lentilactobacillus senioris]MCY9807099.1 alpha/beta hydrolase [Lentilactobacillus senioris]
MTRSTNSARGKILYFTIGGIILLGLFLGFCFQHEQRQKQLKNNYIHSNIPTMFVHGWGGTITSETDMVSAAEKSGSTAKRMVIHVTASGEIKIQGTIKNWMRNPIILLVFDNNRAGEDKYTQWLTKVNELLKSKYHINQINFVGHSMGAYAVIYYNLLNGNSPKVPRVNKIIVMSGPYDGIIDNHKRNQPITGPLARYWDDYPNQNQLLPNGQPKIIHPEYERLLKLRNRMPQQARVINIYGNLNNGSNSDGVISTTSALSLGYLIKDRVNSYATVELTGSKAQHSQQHIDNLKVVSTMETFLWQVK